MTVEIRHWRKEDAEAMHAAITASLEHLRPWMPWIADEPQTVAQRRALIARWDRERRGGGAESFAIVVDGVPAGSCGLHPRIGPGGLEIGYWVHVDHTGRGVATEASRLLCERAFAQPSIDHVEIHHATANVRSGRVPAKLGFTHVEDRPRPPESPGEDGTFSIWRLTREAWARRTT
jgi:RimJ/RimL family protein N-acetyltransferase